METTEYWKYRDHWELHQMITESAREYGNRYESSAYLKYWDVFNWDTARLARWMSDNFRLSHNVADDYNWRMVTRVWEQRHPTFPPTIGTIRQILKSNT